MWLESEWLAWEQRNNIFLTEHHHSQSQSALFSSQVSQFDDEKKSNRKSSNVVASAVAGDGHAMIYKIWKSFFNSTIKAQSDLTRSSRK